METVIQIPEEPRVSAGNDAVSLIAKHASTLGLEIVEVAGALDQIDSDAGGQVAQIKDMESKARLVVDTNKRVVLTARTVGEKCLANKDMLDSSANQMRASMGRSETVAKWVGEVQSSMSTVMDTLKEVNATSATIAGIARQVNILAVNAKIEASRAGDAGRGFTVVAEAINELSVKTAASAAQISQAMQALTENINRMHSDADGVSDLAAEVLSDGEKTDATLKAFAEQMGETITASDEITKEAGQAETVLSGFQPAIEDIRRLSQNIAASIEANRERLHGIVDISEAVVQSSVEAGGSQQDARFIEDVQDRAFRISRRFERALKDREIREEDLFSKTYTKVPGSNPEQVMAPFTLFTDKVLPEFQEEALTLDPRVVFCAACDTEGYLPTHNLKFSKPQGKDPVWNASNARNRRIFNDRVGLKAGRNTKPFLLQVYRRDMGGGAFAMMKDVSAPILVNGRHWGGLRLAFAVK